MQPSPKPTFTAEEYLAIEREAEFRSEYLDGEMFAMSGGSRWHNLISSNIGRELSQQFKGRPCETYSSDQRVHIPKTGLYTYPDIVVACSEPQFQDNRLDVLLNPTLIVEVLSPTTEAYDRGKKFEHYRSLESLSEYLLVAQDTPKVEHYLRQDGNRWLLTAFAGLEGFVPLPSLQCEIALAEIYDKVVFGEERSVLVNRPA